MPHDGGGELVSLGNQNHQIFTKARGAPSDKLASQGSREVPHGGGGELTPLGNRDHKKKAHDVPTDDSRETPCSTAVLLDRQAQSRSDGANVITAAAQQRNAATQQ